MITCKYDYSTFDRLPTGFYAFKEFVGKKHERGDLDGENKICHSIQIGLRC